MLTLQGNASVGHTIEIYWPLDKVHYSARIISYDPVELRHMVRSWQLTFTVCSCFTGVTFNTHHILFLGLATRSLTDCLLICTSLPEILDASSSLTRHDQC
jgi:hypothetical protein